MLTCISGFFTYKIFSCSWYTTGRMLNNNVVDDSSKEMCIIVIINILIIDFNLTVEIKCVVNCIRAVYTCGSD